MFGCNVHVAELAGLQSCLPLLLSPFLFVDRTLKNRMHWMKGSMSGGE